MDCEWEMLTYGVARSYIRRAARMRRSSGKAAGLSGCKSLTLKRHFFTARARRTIRHRPGWEAHCRRTPGDLVYLAVFTHAAWKCSQNAYLRASEVWTGPSKCTDLRLASRNERVMRDSTDKEACGIMWSKILPHVF